MTAASARPHPVLLFDGDCGFCTSTAGLARRWVARRGQFAVLAYQRADLAGYGLTVAQCDQAVQFVDEQWQVASAGRAIARALRAGSTPWPPVGRLLDAPGVRLLTEAVYHWVAAHRSQLPGGTPACSRPG